MWHTQFVDLMSQRFVHFLHNVETLARKGLIPRLAILLFVGQTKELFKAVNQLAEEADAATREL